MPLEVRDAGLGALERGQAALHHRHRRIGEARVDERLFLVGEARRRGRRIGLDEAAGEEERLRVLAPGARRQALAHGERVEPQAFGAASTRGIFARPSGGLCRALQRKRAAVGGGLVLVACALSAGGHRRQLVGTASPAM